MERVDPPEGVQLIRDTTNEVVQTAMKINKTIIEQQAERLAAEAQATEAPQRLPDVGGGGSDE